MKNIIVQNFVRETDVDVWVVGKKLMNCRRGRQLIEWAE